MDVSFSLPTWKVNEIQNIDLKLEEQLYSSTPYNLNDFKSTTQSPELIFKTILTFSQQQNNSGVKKQLIKKQNVSLAIFVVYLYGFLLRVFSKIQKRDSPTQNKLKYLSQSHLKIEKQKKGQQPIPQTERRLNALQENPKNQQFQVLKSFKLKIYQIDLCKLRNVPERFLKYYNNNLLKKIIFQYLSKAWHNISLVQILLQSNQVLCFAISLVSRALVCKELQVQTYNQQTDFHQQAMAFLGHFEKNTINGPLNSINVGTSSTPRAKKSKSFQDVCGSQGFVDFTLNINQMSSKYVSFKYQVLNEQKNYVILIKNQLINKTEKTSSSNRVKQKLSSQSYKKSVPSSKSIELKSQVKILQVKKQRSWSSYFFCFNYFFSGSNPK